MSDPAGVDPEEAMIASLSSCHMLWFLALAANAGLTVDRYLDEASGELDKNEAGKSYLARVALNPVTTFTGRQPDQTELEALHHAAHEHCDMAHSVRSEITVTAALG
jgi:organic hydroperoxide reductase OsmC/OhrA